MIEIYKPQKVDTTHIDAIHGHTTIELKNEKTGIRDRIESDNVVTDGLSDYFRDLGVCLNSPFNSSTIMGRDRLIKSLCGGVYLFDNVIPTSPAAKYKPAGVTMLGNGYIGSLNNSDPQELGSYNGNESSFTDTQAVMVYDYTTSQGNGEIKSVCLTTVAGGKIGYGNPSGTRFSTVWDMYTEQNSPSRDISNPNMNLSTIGFWDNYIYSPTARPIPSGTSVIVFYKTYVPCTTTVDCFHKLYTNEASNQVSFTLPEAVSGSYLVANTGVDNVLAVVPNFNVANNATCTFYLINLQDNTTSKVTFTNKTGNNIHGSQMYILDNTYIVAGENNGDKPLYLMDYTTSTLVGDTGSKTVYYSDGFGCPAHGFKIAPDLYMFNTNAGIYDVSLNQTFPANVTTNWFVNTGQRGSGLTCFYHGVNDMFIWVNTAGGSGKQQICGFKNPLRLMTINNLATPVLKTAAQTMKVSYTLNLA